MPKRIWVPGAGGMLGEAVVWGAKAVHGASVVVIATRHDQVDVTRVEQVYDLVETHKPDVIINCVGVRPEPDETALRMVMANTVAPHVLASTGIPMIHMSTDCVFSGTQRKVPSAPEPQDTYGRSKLAGESLASHVTNVRGSFIGQRHGFFHWAMTATGLVQGYVNAYWNGGAVGYMASALLRLAASPPGGVVVVASRDHMSKFEMLDLLRGHDLPITPVEEPYINRVLPPDIELPSVKASLRHELGLWQTVSR